MPRVGYYFRTKFSPEELGNDEVKHADGPYRRCIESCYLRTQCACRRSHDSRTDASRTHFRWSDDSCSHASRAYFRRSDDSRANASRSDVRFHRSHDSRSHASGADVRFRRSDDPRADASRSYFCRSHDPRADASRTHELVTGSALVADRLEASCVCQGAYGPLDSSRGGGYRCHSNLRCGC
jgi:hypothetical protein